MSIKFKFTVPHEPAYSCVCMWNVFFQSIQFIHRMSDIIEWDTFGNTYGAICDHNGILSVSHIFNLGYINNMNRIIDIMNVIPRIGVTLHVCVEQDTVTITADRSDLENVTRIIKFFRYAAHLQINSVKFVIYKNYYI